MPDTRARKTAQGWVDLDNPSSPYYATRRAVRDARRQVRQTRQSKPFTNTGSTPTTSSRPALVPSVASIPALVQSDPTGLFSGLRKRLFDRLTGRQGVDPADATDVIENNGYNKAASYGHMRAAGANHSEASFVISLESPEVSVAYGEARADGLNHTEALAEALLCQVND